MKEHLTKTKQQHESDLQRVESKHAKELQNLKVALSDKIDSGTQVSCKPLYRLMWVPCGIVGHAHNDALLILK